MRPLLCLIPFLIPTQGSTQVPDPAAAAAEASGSRPRARLEVTDALREKARAIHAAVLTLDTHKDIEPGLALDYKGDDPEEKQAFDQRNDPTVRGRNQVDFPKMREGGLDCAFFIVYVGQGRLDGAGFVLARRQAMLKFDAIRRMAKKYPEHIGLATTAQQVRDLHGAGKLVACIGIENGYPMGTDLGRIEEFHRLGARYMGIAHTGHNQLGDAHTPAEPLHGGLSDLGRKAIAEMNRVGIMVDISHASDAAMTQAMEISKAPVIASHSGCDGVREHTRNLSDAHLLQLKRNGGVIQCVALGSFVKDTSARQEARAKLRETMGLPGRRELYRMRSQGIPKEIQEKLDAFEARVKAEIDPVHRDANVQDFVDHIDYAVAKIGIDHVAISSDFDGGGGIVGWNDASETFNVTLELVRRGYTEEEIGKLWSGNTLRVLEAVETVARRLQGGGR